MCRLLFTVCLLSLLLHPAAAAHADASPDSSAILPDAARLAALAARQERDQSSRWTHTSGPSGAWSLDHPADWIEGHLEDLMHGVGGRLSAAHVDAVFAPRDANGDDPWVIVQHFPDARGRPDADAREAIVNDLASRGYDVQRDAETIATTGIRALANGRLARTEGVMHFAASGAVYIEFAAPVDSFDAESAVIFARMRASLAVAPPRLWSADAASEDAIADPSFGAIALLISICVVVVVLIIRQSTRDEGVTTEVPTSDAADGHGVIVPPAPADTSRNDSRAA